MIPERLAASCQKTPERSLWLTRLPAIVRDLEQRWSLAIGPPFVTAEASCAWVAPATLKGGTPAVLKVGIPHFEAEDEIAGLRFWDGDATVRLFEADHSLDAMLLERCEPGTHLRELRDEAEHDAIIARLLRRLWRSPGARHRFRPLSALTAYWTEEALGQSAQWPDAGLAREGLSLLNGLAETTNQNVLLATDLHAGNVLRAEREPWLVIDPKPFVGDPAFDATQHLLNSVGRLRADALGTVRRFADLLEVDPERIRLWMFARLAAEPRNDWHSDDLTEIARALAP